MGQDAFQLIDNIYYVGTTKVSSHLFTSGDGHVLIDACYPDDGSVISRNIRTLGIDPKDIRYLLITHAHTDHLGGAAYLADQTGACVCIGKRDVHAAEHGSKIQKGLTGFMPVKIDKALREDDCINVGQISIQVYDTPGHTPGCCSFGFEVKDRDKRYNGLLFGGPGVNVFQKENLKRNIYGGTIKDFINSVKRLLTFEVDVWLGAHPGLNHTFEKREQLQQSNESNPYVDPQGWKSFLKQCLLNAEQLLPEIEKTAEPSAARDGA